VLPESLNVQDWIPENALIELLRGRLEGLGPVTAKELAASLDIELSQLNFALASLEAEGFVFQGHYTPLTARGGSSGDKEWCERRLLHRIHRYTIDAHRESIKPVSLQVYMQFLFTLHDIQPHSTEPRVPGIANADTLRRVLTQLDGVTAPATAWEGDILPARLPNYDPAWLDQLCISGQICWGRLLRPHEGNARSGPVKSTPLNIVQRRNIDLWQTLAGSDNSPLANVAWQTNSASPPGESGEAPLSSGAMLLHGILQRQGAMFFTDLVRVSNLLAVQVEHVLAELVSAGLVTSDNFTGLRALLTPDANKPKHGSHDRRRAIYGIEDAGRWSLLTPLALHADAEGQGDKHDELGDEQLERLVAIYLKRWGVITRKVLEREQNAPPWRTLLLKLHRMELRGEIRGGRFIAGVGGEQFALPDTVTALRKQQKLWQEQQDSNTPHVPKRVVLNATDPLNLVGTLLPEKKVPHLSGNRILFEDGLPVAVLEKDEVRILRGGNSEEQWQLQQLLQRHYFPPRLRAYLGKQ
jgi:ATP-dependent Lhr-like helicase